MRGVAVLPLEVVRADICFLLRGGKAVAIAPPRFRRCHAIGVGARRAQLHLHRARLGQRVTERASVGRVIDAVDISFETELPVVADAALHAESGLREAGIR